jgi:FMN reductase [NAD(P)H]
VDLSVVDLCAAGALLHEPHHSIDRVGVAFEDRLDGAVATVRDPPGDSALSRALAYGPAEADPLDEPSNDDAASNHAAYSRRVELREILRRRRMVRAYEPEPVPREAIERIVATVRRAPSAGFSQGQRLLVVTDPATREDLARLFDEEASIAEGREPWISAAPVLVVVGAREQDYHDRYTRPDKLQEGEEIQWPVPYWHFDAGAAAMLVLLAAIDEGYAAGLFGVPVELMQPFKQLLDIPADVAVTSCITIGKPADDPGWSAGSSRLTQRRKSVDDLVHWERWG